MSCDVNDDMMLGDVADVISNCHPAIVFAIIVKFSYGENA